MSQTDINTSTEYDHLDEEREAVMSLGEHLEELRIRILVSLGCIVIFSIVGGVFAQQIHAFLLQPYQDATEHPLLLQAVFGPIEVIIRIALLSGFIASFPFVLFIIWGFISPAVTRKAAILGNISVLISALLFYAGLAFAWVYVFPFSLHIMFTGFLPEGTIAQTSLEKYYSFLFLIHLGAGLLFQIPLLIVALGALGILTIAWHKKTWRYAVVMIFVFSAFVTPPDPISMAILASPLIVLYILAIGIVWLIERIRRKRFEKEFGPEA